MKRGRLPLLWAECLNLCGGGSKYNLGPGRTGQIFVYFAKKISVTSFLRQVRPVIFRSTKFCQSLPNFKDAVVLPRSRTNFCQASNLPDLLIYTPPNKFTSTRCKQYRFLTNPKSSVCFFNMLILFKKNSYKTK